MQTFFKFFNNKFNILNNTQSNAFHSSVWYGEYTDFYDPENPEAGVTAMADLPSVQEFSDLHMTENVKTAFNALNHSFIRYL